MTGCIEQARTGSHPNFINRLLTFISESVMLTIGEASCLLNEGGFYVRTGIVSRFKEYNQ